MSDPAQPLLSPLHDRHVALGAKLGDFGGWSMPLEYAGGGVVAEHTAVRERVGVFDVSHLGKASVTGPGAAAFLDSVLTNSLGRIAPGKAQYTLLCDENGGVVDDLIAYLRRRRRRLPHPQRRQHRRGRPHPARPRRPTASRSTNGHRDHAVLAVQGPRSAALLDALGLPTDLEYMAFEKTERDGVPLTVCRTGYTGEHGYELVVPWDDAGAVWDALLAAGRGVRRAAVRARRARHPAHRDGLPAARAGPLAGDHAGAGAGGLGRRLEQAGVPRPRRAASPRRSAGPVRRSVGLVALERGIPRPHMTVTTVDGEALGEITQRHVLPDAQGRHRARPALDERGARGRRRGARRRARPRAALRRDDPAVHRPLDALSARPGRAARRPRGCGSASGGAVTAYALSARCRRRSRGGRHRRGGALRHRVLVGHEGEGPHRDDQAQDQGAEGDAVLATDARGVRGVVASARRRAAAARRSAAVVGAAAVGVCGARSRSRVAVVMSPALPSRPRANRRDDVTCFTIRAPSA